MIYEVSIQACASGFGEFQCQPINGEGWADASDLLSEISSNGIEFWELGADELIEGAEDIRGRIHNEPERVFAARQGDSIFYFGLTSK